MKKVDKKKLLTYCEFLTYVRECHIDVRHKFDCVISVCGFGFQIIINDFQIPITKECFRLIVKRFGKNMNLDVLSYILDYE